MADISKIQLPSGVTYNIKDEKVKQTPLNGANSGKGLLFSSSTGSSETTSTVYTSNGLMWNDYGGNLSVYNTSHEKYGFLNYSSLRLANSSTDYVGYLRAGNVTADRNYYLPDKAGTIALTTDIPSNISSFTNDSGYLTLATLPIYDGTVTTP